MVVSQQPLGLVQVRLKACQEANIYPPIYICTTSHHNDNILDVVDMAVGGDPMICTGPASSNAYLRLVHLAHNNHVWLSLLAM